jgi:hypothetical protein
MQIWVAPGYGSCYVTDPVEGSLRDGLHVESKSCADTHLRRASPKSASIALPPTTSMSDQHLEEQEMEAEALAAIFDTAFEIRSSEQPFVWAVKLVPVDCGGDADEEEAKNHIMVKLVAHIPLDYPEGTLPRLDLEIIKGLSQDNKDELLRLADDEAEANAGMPAIFAVCEAVRSWLADNNVKGLDDASMHAQMMRKAKDAERREVSVTRAPLVLTEDELYDLLKIG